jgi:hypothetical protein
MGRYPTFKTQFRSQKVSSGVEVRNTPEYRKIETEAMAFQKLEAENIQARAKHEAEDTLKAKQLGYEDMGEFRSLNGFDPYDPFDRISARKLLASNKAKTKIDAEKTQANELLVMKASVLGLSLALGDIIENPDPEPMAMIIDSEDPGATFVAMNIEDRMEALSEFDARSQQWLLGQLSEDEVSAIQSRIRTGAKVRQLKLPEFDELLKDYRRRN